MTNGEKAQEIAKKYCEYYDGSKEADSTSYNSAMQMAKWKDEEHNECAKELWNSGQLPDFDNDEIIEQETTDISASILKKYRKNG